MIVVDWSPASLARKAKSVAVEDILASRRTLFARALAEIFSVTANKTVEVAAGPVQTLKLSEWQALQNPFGTVLHYESPNVPDQIALHLPGLFVSQLLDLHYGGSGQVRSQSSFTAAELKFAGRLGDRFCQPLSQMYATRKQSDLRLVTQVNNLLDFQGPTTREQIYLMPFFVEAAGLKAATVNCWAAMDVVDSLIEVTAEEGMAGDLPAHDWRSTLQRAALNIPVSTNAVLAQSKIGMDRLLTLAAGDILPILVRPKVPLMAGGKQIALGTVGEAQGMAAFKIENIGENLQ